MIWTKTDEAIAASASVVATAMLKALLDDSLQIRGLFL